MDFRMIAKISMSKDTERFHPYEEKEFDSGWKRKSIKFNAISGDNRHMLTVNAGAFADGHGDVYTFTKGYVDDNGNRVKGESIKIPFKDRLTSKRLPEVAEFRKFVFDLDNPNRRRDLQQAIDKVSNGESVTDEMLNKRGVESESDLKDALDKSNKKRHEFISEWDFVDFIKKVIDSGKYNNSKFYITGNAEYQYSDKNETVYESLIPQKIYLVGNDEEEYSVANLKFYYGRESLDTMSIEDKGRAYVNGYIFERDNNRRDTIPVPVTVAIMAPGDDADDKAKRYFEGVKRKFTVDDDSYKELLFSVDMINGAQQQEIDVDSLPDEVREDIECGLVTLDQVRKEIGVSYGDRIKEYRFKEIGRGYKATGRQDTSYTDDDFVIKPIEKEDPTEDLFDDDDEL